MSNFEAMIDSVIAIDGSKSRSDVLLDLEYTKSAEETINRIFDGKFLDGVQRKLEDALVILDSDEEEEQRSELRSPELPTNRDSFDFLDDTPRRQRDAFDYLSDTPPPKKNDVFDFLDDTPPKKDVYNILSDTPSLPKNKDPFDFLDYTPPPKKIDVLGSLKSNRPKKIDTLDFLDELPPIGNSYLDNTPSPKRDALDFLEDDFNMAEDQPIYDLEDDVMFERRRSPKRRLSPKRSPKKHVSLDSLEELSPIRCTVRQDELPKERHEDSFSYQTKATYSDDDDNFLGTFSLEPSSRKRKASPLSISLIDSDSDDSLPSVNDFFGQLMSQKGKPDRKGKQKVYSSQISEPMSECSSTHSEEPVSNFSLTDKERKKLETAERKRLQAKEKKRATDEKKRKRDELLEERKRIKEQKALEKERMAIFEKENRIKNNRVEVIKEMIVEMHPDFIETKAGESLKMILEKKETVIRKANPAPYHLIWRRICNSGWDEDSMAFIPYPEPKIVKEPFVLVYVDLYGFFRHIQEKTTDSYVDNIKRAAGPGQQVILLIEGLQTYYKKKLNLQRRLFDDQVRSTIEGASTSASRRKSQPEIENGPDHKQVEESLNYLIVQKGIMLVMTKNDQDTVSWIECLTTDLAIGRYKLKNLNTAYKSRTACIDPTDNYNKLLQEIQLCTQPVAISVTKEYPTLQSLHRAYEGNSKTAGEQMVADLDVERSVINPRDRKVNRSMSKRIYQIFCSTDPNEIIN